jgi:hypothetical protein
LNCHFAVQNGNTYTPESVSGALSFFVPSTSASTGRETAQSNLRGALERIIEQAGEVEVTASAVVAAVQAYAKINAQGQWIERSEHLNLNELFERMTQAELEKYARDAELPAWFRATLRSGQEAESD